LNTEEPRTLDASVQNFAVQATWHPVIVHPWNDRPPKDEARTFTQSVRTFAQDYMTSHLKRQWPSKVKFCPCVIPYHAMNTHRGVEAVGMAVHVFSSSVLGEQKSVDPRMQCGRS